MHQRKALILFVLLLMLPAVPIQGQTVKKTVTFQPNSIPDLDVYYEDYSFVFELKDYFIRVRPFVIYDGQYYGMRQIVTWIKNNYPNIDYKWLINKAEKAIHYGFNLTKLPQAVADKIDYLGFRLVDLNFPLSWFELETIEPMPLELNHSITRIHIPKANLRFSFEDLYPFGYSVAHVNSTYILVGNVKGKTDLIVDPIIYSSGVITVTGETDQWMYDVWLEDQTQGWNVFHNHKENNSQFQSDVRIQIGNGWASTIASDTEKQLTFSDGCFSGDWQALIAVRAAATLRSGVLNDAEARRTSRGCQFVSLENTYRGYFIYNWENNANIEMYSTVFMQKGNARDSLRNMMIKAINSKLYNCIFGKNTGVRYSTDADIYRATFSEAEVGLADSTGTMNDLVIYDCAWGIYATLANSYIISDTKVYGSTVASLRTWALTTNCYLIDVECDAWTITWGSANTGKIYRQNTFSLTLSFSNNTKTEGANVTISNMDGLVGSWLTDEDGGIPDQILSMGYYQQSTGNTLNSYNPYNLTITYSGFQTYSKNWTLSEKTSWQIALLSTDRTESAGDIPKSYFYIGIILAAIVSAIIVSCLLESK